MSFRLGCGAAILGAILAQPLVFGLAFAWGAVFGSHELMASGPGHTSYGVEGGQGAVGNLAFLYLISVGIIPVVVSAVGAAACVTLVFVIRWLRRGRTAEASKA